MIQRYDLTEDVSAGVVSITPVPESHEGRFVRYADYKKLQRQLDEVRGHLRRTQSTMNFDFQATCLSNALNAANKSGE